ncbi:MAG: hypothetical protein R3264_13310, partial [Anaerolineae bacterium]|nr:hypothetical protein [Anaerolineae bacterium]
MENPEFFGNELQVSLQENCLRAWPTLENNSKINFSGRNFGWDDPKIEDIDLISDLANTFGVVALFFTPKDILQTLIDNLKVHQLDV